MDFQQRQLYFLAPQILIMLEHGLKDTCLIVIIVIDSWKYVYSDLAKKCRRKMLLQLVGEENPLHLVVMCVQ